MHHLASVMARGGERGGRGVVAGGSSGVRAARAASGVAFNRQACEDDRGSRGVCGVPHTSGTTIRRVNSLRRMWRPLDCTPDSGSWRGGHFQRRTRRPNSRDTCGPVLPPQRTAAAGSAASAQMQPSSSSSFSAGVVAAGHRGKPLFLSFRRGEHVALFAHLSEFTLALSPPLSSKNTGNTPDTGVYSNASRRDLIHWRDYDSQDRHS